MASSCDLFFCRGRIAPVPLLGSRVLRLVFELIVVTLSVAEARAVFVVHVAEMVVMAAVRVVVVVDSLTMKVKLHQTT
jgi:hypothetical protein